MVTSTPAQVALTKAKANLLGTALTSGVSGDLLRIALTQAREDTLAAALTAADPDLLTAALTEASPNLLATALTDAEVGQQQLVCLLALQFPVSDDDVQVGLPGVALTRGVARELLITALTRWETQGRTSRSC